MEPNTIAPPARNYYKLAALPFLLSHVLVLGALWSGVTWQAVICCFVLTVTGLLGVMAGYHRYFSHRTFRTSRVFQFVLAVLAQMTAQKGVLWWASHHRMHHKCSDQPGDSHSPIVDGFFYAHIGWILDDTDSFATPYRYAVAQSPAPPVCSPLQPHVFEGACVESITE